MKTFNNIATLVRVARNKTTLSQQDLSWKLGYKNGQFISNVERALCSVPLKKAPQLCEVLDINMEHFKDACVQDLKSNIDNAFEKYGRRDSNPQTPDWKSGTFTNLVTAAI